MWNNCLVQDVLTHPWHQSPSLLHVDIVLGALAHVQVYGRL
jgi:hypothetical protein